MICDGSQCFLCPILQQAEYMLPGDEIDTEKEGICPSNCNIKPFDASFSPRNPSCPFKDIGLDYTLTSPPPPSPIDPTIDVQQQLSANAEQHHQRAERAKYRRGGDTVDDADLSLPDPPTPKDLGELYIGEINRANRLLLPASIGPYGDIGPIFRNFLFGQAPRTPLSAFRNRPQANTAHLRATTHPAPFDIVTTASINWKRHKSQRFFGNSYTTPTPRAYFLQKFGLHTTKALAVLLQNSFKRIVSAPPGSTTAHRTPHRPDHRPTPISPDTPLAG